MTEKNRMHVGTYKAIKKGNRPRFFFIVDVAVIVSTRGPPRKLLLL
jgi:hypothetical protein